MVFNARRVGRRWLRVAVATVILGGVALLVASSLFPWTRLNCLHQDVDVRSGRLRDTRYLFYCRVSEQVRDSGISLALGPEAGVAGTADWRRVITLSPPFTRHSPHYVFHSASAQIHSIEGAWQVAPFSSEAKREIARTLLLLWQRTGNDSGADEYVLKIVALAAECHGKHGQTVAVEDLVSP